MSELNKNAPHQQQLPKRDESLPNADAAPSVDEKLDRTNDYLAQLLRHSEKLTDNTLAHQQNMMR